MHQRRELAWALRGHPSLLPADLVLGAAQCCALVPRGLVEQGDGNGAQGGDLEGCRLRVPPRSAWSVAEVPWLWLPSAAGILRGHSTLRVVLSRTAPGTCSWKVSSAKTFTSLAQLKANGPVSQGRTGEARAQGSFQPFLPHRWVVVPQHMSGRAAPLPRVLVRMTAAARGVTAELSGAPLDAAARQRGLGRKGSPGVSSHGHTAR